MNLLLRFAIMSMAIMSCQQNKSQSKSQPAGDTGTILTEYRKHFRDSLPGPSGYINDYENIYSESEEGALDSLIAAFEKSDSIQIAVISFDSSMIERDSLDAMTLRIANEWGVGQKYKNNGITISICIGYRKMRIQNGMGIEKLLTNNETKEIIDSVFIPAFSDKQFFTGTYEGIASLISRLRKHH
ncbi:MAG: TPM domain-containing protein [Ferruginibacter sp.]